MPSRNGTGADVVSEDGSPLATAWRSGRKPLFSSTEQEQLRGIGTCRDFARDPAVVVLIHVGVIFNMTAERAVEVPEPVGPEQVPPRTPECRVKLVRKLRIKPHSVERGGAV